MSIEEERVTTSGALCILFAALDELDRRYDDHDDSPTLVLDDMAPPLGLFLVARLDGHPAGGVGLRPIGDPALRAGEIKRLWVRPDLRRDGVAAALMDRAEQRARHLGYHQLFLETGPRQPEAMAFYAKNDWLGDATYPPGAFSHPGASRFTKLL